MPNLTVQAADTASAMEQIWEKLGPDAMIVSTTKRKGRVIMEATTDTLNTEKNPARSGVFQDIFTGQMLDSKSKDIISMKSPPNIKQTKNSEIAGLRRDISSMRDMLSGMVLTDLDGLNPSLIGSTRVSLQQAGFSGPILDKLKESFAEKTYHKGSEAFLSALASYLVDPDPEKLLTKRIIFVVGSSGTGRTTMTAKLVAVLRESHPNKEIVAATLFGQAAGSTTSLQSFGRLLNIPVCSLDLLTPASDFDKMTDYDTMIIDVVACPEEAVKKIKDIKAHVGDKDLATVITIPGSTSSAMINLTMEQFQDVHPMVALTKLDECETTAAEFSALAENSANIGVLSGTKSVIGAAMFASENILLQYLKENFIS